jgi:hypothetical protein
MTKKVLVPKSPENEGDCKVLEQKITGNKVVWKVRCLDPRRFIRFDDPALFSSLELNVAKGSRRSGLSWQGIKPPSGFQILE